MKHVSYTRHRYLPDVSWARIYTLRKAMGRSVGAIDAAGQDPVCQSAFKRGSDAILLTMSSRRADEPCLQKVDFGAPVHLTLDQLEFCDLAFGLSI